MCFKLLDLTVVQSSERLNIRRHVSSARVAQQLIFSLHLLNVTFSMCYTLSIVGTFL